MLPLYATKVFSHIDTPLVELLLSVTTYLIHLPHGQHAHYLHKHHLETAKELYAPWERIHKEKWTNLAQQMKPTNPCLSHQRRRHMAGPPLSHSTSTLIDTVNPSDVPRLADKSMEAGGGSFIATEYPRVSSYYHNISRLPSSLWTLRCRQQHLTSPSPFLRLPRISPPHTWKTGD